MDGLTRRRFLAGLGSMGAGAALASWLPSVVDRAYAASAGACGGSLSDIEHFVFLMQENRSFDHYYGTMRGVRGFGDRAALTLGSGQDVFHQPDSARSDGGYLLPFHVATTKGVFQLDFLIL